MQEARCIVGAAHVGVLVGDDFGSVAIGGVVVTDFHGAEIDGFRMRAAAVLSFRSTGAIGPVGVSGGIAVCCDAQRATPKRRNANGGL